MKTHHIVLIGVGIVGVVALIKFWPKAKPVTGNTGKSTDGTLSDTDPLAGKPAHTNFTGPKDFANFYGGNWTISKKNNQNTSGRIKVTVTESGKHLCFDTVNQKYIDCSLVNK